MLRTNSKVATEKIEDTIQSATIMSPGGAPPPAPCRGIGWSGPSALKMLQQCFHGLMACLRDKASSRRTRTTSACGKPDLNPRFHPRPEVRQRQGANRSITDEQAYDAAVLRRLRTKDAAEADVAEQAKAGCAALETA